MNKFLFPAALFAFLLSLSFVFVGPAVAACTFAGSGVPAPCTFTIDATDSSCAKDITAVTVTSLIDNNKINESATYVDLGAQGRVSLIAAEDKTINTGQSMRLYAVRDDPLPVGASVVVVASGISDTKSIVRQGCNCSIILANATASFDPDSGVVLANGTIRGGCPLSGILFAIVNKTTGLASERALGFPPGNTFLVPTVGTYTSEEASGKLQVLLLAYGSNGALGASAPPIGSFKDFKISLPKTSLDAEPGKLAPVAVTVTNFNNEPDTYTATASVPQDWSSESVVFSVGPNSASNQTIGVTPSQLTFSGTQSAVVSVTSSSTGKTRTASISLSPSSLKPSLKTYLYPPKVVLIGRPFDAKAVINATAPGTALYFFYTEPFVKMDSSEGKTQIPAGLSGLTGATTTAVRDICALPDSAKFLRKMDAYWSVMKDVIPGKDPILIKKVFAKIDSYRGSVTTPSLSAVRSNVSAVVSSLESHQDVDARIAAIVSDIGVLKAELAVEENKTTSSPKVCRPVASANLVIDFVSYSDASESTAASGLTFASGDVLNARLLDESGNAVTSVNMRPGEVRNLGVEITNGDTETRQFTVEVTDGVLANFISLEKSQLTIEGGQVDGIGLTIQMPTVISGAKNATLVVSSSPYIKSVPIVVTMSGPALSGQDLYTLEPGVSATLSFSIKNNDKADDAYSLSISGAPDKIKWFTIPKTLTVAGGKEGKIQVKANAPSTAATGAYNFTISADSQKSGAGTKFAFAVFLSGEFKALRAQALEVDAINAQIKEKCSATVVDTTALKDARSLITAGRLSEAKAKIDLARSNAERALADCTAFKFPFVAALLVLGGLAVAYFWFFVRKPAPPAKPPLGRPPANIPSSRTAPRTATGTGTELPTNKEDEETWI